jgi:hypothetical protein
MVDQHEPELIPVQFKLEHTKKMFPKRSILALRKIQDHFHKRGY